MIEPTYLKLVLSNFYLNLQPIFRYGVTKVLDSRNLEFKVGGLVCG